MKTPKPTAPANPRLPMSPADQAPPTPESGSAGNSPFAAAIALSRHLPSAAFLMDGALTVGRRCTTTA